MLVVDVGFLLPLTLLLVWLLLLAFDLGDLG